MSKTARLYSDTRTASAAADAAPSNLDKLNGELQDVTRIMTKNMEELLWRGDSLDREFLFYLFVYPGIYGCTRPYVDVIKGQRCSWPELCRNFECFAVPG